MSWARWHCAETKSLYLVGQQSQLPQEGFFEPTYLACLVLYDLSILLPLLSWVFGETCVHTDSRGSTGPLLLGVPPFCIDVYCCSFLSSLHNERNATYRGTEITWLLRKGKQMQQNELCSGSHQGFFYWAWHIVVNKLTYLVPQSIADWKQQIKRRDRDTARGKKSENSEKCQLRARENNINHGPFNISPNCPKYNWSLYRTYNNWHSQWWLGVIKEGLHGYFILYKMSENVKCT